MILRILAVLFVIAAAVALVSDALQALLEAIGMAEAPVIGAALDGIAALRLTSFERYLVGFVLAASAFLAWHLSLLLGAEGGKAKPQDKAPAVYDAELAAGAPRRRITDRGRQPILYGSAVAVVFFGGLIAWSSLAPLESAAVAQAKVRVESNRYTIDHPDGGVISALFVQEGDSVREGQTLIRLDPTEITSELAVLSRRRDSLRTLNARLEAERDELSAIEYPEDILARAKTDDQLAAMVNGQNTLFAASSEAFEGEIAVGEQRITQLKERIDGLRAELASIENQLVIIKEESDDLEELLRKGLTPQRPVLELRREKAKLEGSTGSLVAEIAQTETRIGETRLSIIQLRRNRLAETSETLRTTLAELLELEPRFEALETRLARTKLRAPSSGVVFDLQKFTTGGVIRPGEPILDIVPDSSALVVEARISPIDRDVISAGMDARVRFTAFSFRSTEPVDGRLTRVSADALTDEATRELYYVGVIEVPGDALESQEIAIKPGMPAEVTIPLRARTILQYIIEPLVQNWEHTFREE
ncbi:MAG: HlyD family type I secretion periplasmic adaptor subunit [Pseudomonadota bacterium]